MLDASFSISPQRLWNLIGTTHAPRILDVRRGDVFDKASGLIPGAARFDPAQFAQWSQDIDTGQPIVVACKAGHELSQSVAARLRANDVEARILQGGYDGWVADGLPLVDKAALAKFAPQRPSVWVTRRRPKIDRVACPWLVRRFIDPDARILYVDPPEVVGVAKQSGGVPFDIEGVELSHEGPRCSFDTILKLFGLEGDPALARLALIVRGADTAQPGLAPEAAGLHAISLGLSTLSGDDDHGMIAQGFLIYDALLAWLRFAGGERHNWVPATDTAEARAAF
jgi:rhodanese-related sulfurtransferase